MVFIMRSSSVLTTNLSPGAFSVTPCRAESVQGRKNGVGENWVIHVFQKGENTHYLFYCFKHMCHTGSGNGRYKHGRPGRQALCGGANFCCTAEGWPNDFTAAPKGSSSELANRAKGSRASHKWVWPARCGSCEVQQIPTCL